MRAIAYIRRSKDPVEGNSSLTDQRKWIEEETLRRGHSLSDLDILEEVVSAYRERKRPQRDRLEKMLADKDVVALYVRDLDRLARRMVDTARIVDICNRHAVTIYTHDRVFAPGSPDTILIVSILGGMAETEAATTSKRLKRTAESIRLRGGWNGMAPYGWVVREERSAEGVKTLALHPDESKVVRQIVDWKLSGRSVAEITRELSQNGIRNRQGNPFQYRAVAAILRHPVLAGYNSITAKALGRTSGPGPDFRDTRQLVYGKDGRPVQSHEAVCSPQEWDLLRILMKPQPLKKTRERADGLPLVGLMFCGVCNSKMTSNRSAGESGSYVCNGRMKGLNCSGVAIAASAVEEFIRELVGLILDDPEMRDRQREHLRELSIGASNSVITELQKQSAELESSIEAINAQLDTAPAMTVATLLDRVRNDLHQKEQIDAQLSSLVHGRPSSIPPITGASFRTTSLVQQKLTIRSVIRKIAIFPPDVNRGSVKGLFGSQGTNLSRIGVWLIGESDDLPPRRGEGYSLIPTTSEYQCDECEEPRFFRHKNNLRHHQRYAHPKLIPCPECGDRHPLPGMPSHRLHKHGVTGKSK